MSNIIYEVVVSRNPVFEVVVNNGAKGNGVIAGGTTNQVLVKKSNSDYDTMWVTASVVTPVDSVNGQVGDVVLDYEDVGASPVGHNHDDIYYTDDETDTLLNNKVDKITGKGLSTEDYTSAEKTKLSGIEAGAEVNNISDVNATDLTDGGETTLHIHDGRYYTETEADTLLGNKVDKVAGKSLVSDTAITDLTDGGDTTLHTHKSIVNEVSVDNAKVEALSTGAKITRNVNDGNQAVIINQQHASSTGHIIDLQKSGVSKVHVTSAGILGVSDIKNTASANNSYIELYSTGTKISRNIADANPALIVNQANASSTGKILDLQFGGSSQASVSSTGILTSNYVKSQYFQNPSNSDYSQFILGASGVEIKRNIADANSALKVNQVNASSTGLITDFQFGGVSKVGITTTGVVKAPYIAMPTHENYGLISLLSTGIEIKHNQADANPALIVNQANASSTGKILDLQFGGVSKASVGTDGAFAVSGTFSSSGNATSSGYFRTPNGMYNSTNGITSSLVAVQTSGVLVERDIADANTALKVNQKNASSTGLITDFQFGGVSKASVDKDGIIKIGTKTPSSATDTGVAGQIAWDANYIYVCTATNTWKRVAIATW